MQTTYGPNVTVERVGHVAAVTLNRPPHNFVSVALMRSLADAFAAVDADPQARAIVLQADGKSFSAGADFSGPSETGSDAPAGDAPAGDASPGATPLYAEAIRLYSARTPIVAAVQGAAIGAGLGLALVADFRVASPEARFAANFVKLGFHPGFGITYALPRLIGEQGAALMMLTGRRIKGEEALAWGLADDLVPAEDLRAAAMRLASEIAESAPLAVAATRATLRAGLADRIAMQTDLENREQMILRGTEDFREGIRAVAERRAGAFVGR
ncbi:enoyl-CoA hydratase/isomerase family protein [Phenylobacterium sp.]|uniref:enoyl-CoA hydratase/isomerase family protein n=1 Tax=Phenylobacterium sp. TaxID=1871053 RepID=UPI00301C9A95